MRKDVLYGLAAVVMLVAALVYFGGTQEDRGGRKITIPNLSSQAKAGQAVFEANCQLCHGKHAAGTRQGPPLVHIIYEPNHHSDAAFYRAARNGVRAHHWRFGNMPPVPGVTREDVTKIIRYVRELQRANGIY